MLLQAEKKGINQSTYIFPAHCTCMAQNEVDLFNTAVDVDPYVDPYVYSLAVDNMYSVY